MQDQREHACASALEPWQRLREIELLLEVHGRLGLGLHQERHHPTIGMDGHAAPVVWMEHASP
jgi:hypothetical protein